MPSCLVTTLKGVVNDDSLLHMGDIVLKKVEDADNSKAVRLDFEYSSPVVCIAEGGNFLSESGSDLGKTVSFPAGGFSLYPNSSVTQIILRGGYNARCLGLYGKVNSSPANFSLYAGYLQFQPNMAQLNANNGSGFTLTGGLDVEKMSLSKISVFRLIQKELVPLKVFANLPYIYCLQLGNCAKGNISDLSSNTHLEEVSISAPSGELTGDLSALPKNLWYFSASTYDKYTWKGTRPASAKIINMYGVNLGDDIDAALINLAQCTAPKIVRAIQLFGTRTSASDEAVATLQGMGFTITVTEA